MYFIVNKENFVVAASEKFLQKIGARDICLISSMYKDGSIVVDKENKELRIIPRDVSFDVEYSKLYSAFGELSQYRIYSKEDKVLEIKDEDNNSYLKKIKKGVIEKEDTEFDIPEIDTLKKDITSKEPITSQEKQETEAVDLKDTLETIELKTDIEDKAKEVEDVITKTGSEVTQEEDKSVNKNIEKENLELLKELESIDPVKSLKEDTQTEEAAQKVQESESFEIPPIPLEKLELKKAKKAAGENVKKDDAIDELANKIIEETEENDKLHIENELNRDIDFNTKTDEHAQDDITLKMVTIDTGSTEVETKESKTKKRASFFPWSKKSKEEDLQTEKVKIETEESLPEIDISNDETTKIDLEKTQEHKEEFLAPADEKNSELEALEKALMELESNEATKEENKEAITSLQTLKDTEPSKEIEEIQELKATEKAVEAEDVKKTSTKANKHESHIVERIISAQIASLDLEDNAKYLNLDLTSYKMLLDSYISEIETHKNAICEKDTKTIDMLIDAGQLLNVDSIVHKLTKLKESTDDKSKDVANEIEIYTSLLKDKISSDTKVKKTEQETAQSQQVTEIAEENIYKQEMPKEQPSNSIQEVTQQHIDNTEKAEESINRDLLTKDEDEFLLVELTNDKELLNAVTPKEIHIDIKHTAMELNLPESLVDEFIRDFDIQSKEHLPILIKAYKKQDMKQLHDTAHMLKGAANNLRLNPIAETLLRLQNEKNLDNVAKYIKKFAAYTKGLDIAIKEMESSDNENQK